MRKTFLSFDNIMYRLMKMFSEMICIRGHLEEHMSNFAWWACVTAIDQALLGARNTYRHSYNAHNWFHRSEGPALWF